MLIGQQLKRYNVNFLDFKESHNQYSLKVIRSLSPQHARYRLIRLIDAPDEITGWVTESLNKC